MFRPFVSLKRLNQLDFLTLMDVLSREGNWGYETQYFTKKRVCFFDLIKMEKRYTFSIRRRWFIKHEQSLLYARVEKNH